MENALCLWDYKPNKRKEDEQNILSNQPDQKSVASYRKYFRWQKKM